MSRARVAVLKSVSKQLTVTATAAEYGFCRRVWEAIIAVADLAGGSWPTMARDAATHLVHAEKGILIFQTHLSESSCRKSKGLSGRRRPGSAGSRAGA
ncbi:DUF3631 domain-containing protein [Diaminobutyricibacter sp. McL0618]|uniref:DUF3631 domain-containing protein n=1 Tax=Leifsonia sp. McL0618 TaxID=3415677 RepID=UPI003CEABBFB